MDGSVREETERRENNFPLCYRINSMKIQFRFPVVENVQFFADVHRRVPPTFAFLIFYFVKVSCSCVSIRYLKPVNSQQTHFRPHHPGFCKFFPSRHRAEKNRFCCDDMLDGNGALLTNNINDVKWKMKLGV